jgi:hypothetical protein
MIKKLLIAAIFLSANALASDPEAGATCGTAYGFEVCVWPTYGAGGFDDEYGLRASYKNNEKWIFLAEKTHFISNFTTKDSTDAYFRTFITGINDAITTQLKPIGAAEPDSGIARIQWLAGRLCFVEDQLSCLP